LDIRKYLGILSIVSLLAPTPARADEGSMTEMPRSSSTAIAAGVEDALLRSVLFEVLERNPEIAAAAARVTAGQHQTTRQGALPNPQAELTAYLLPPETRVGPQRASLSVSQVFPGGGKRGLRSRSASQEATALSAELEALRLRMITEARRIYHEIAYLDGAAETLATDHRMLVHFEELARARYAAGAGLQQEVVSIQAEITRLDARASTLAARRAGLEAALNFMRDRAGEAVPRLKSPAPQRTALDWDELRSRALAVHPEVAALSARLERAETDSELARKGGAPDFKLGLFYAYVDHRHDVDPPDNGQDVLGINGGISLPVWRSAVDAAIEEAAQLRLSIEARRRASIAAIDRELGELRAQLPEIDRRLSLFEGILRTQTEQALRSAEAAYASGRLDALALLDAERTLLDVRLSAERGRADHAIAIARLEGAIAGPLESHLTRRHGGAR
jgi:outer membrane protein TolC